LKVLRYFFEIQILELQIFDRYKFEFHISEETFCRTNKFPTRQVVEHSTNFRNDKFSNIQQNFEHIGLLFFSDDYPLRGIFIEVRCSFLVQLG
jgi:hypothetical protein